MLEKILDYPALMLCITLIYLSGMYVALHFIKNKYELSPEISRKMVHIGLGLTTLSFPWLFYETWPIWLMCAVSVIALVGLRHKKFKNNLGQALHGVERHSYGEICFPLSVAVLFQLSHEEPVFYLVPILVLTLADAFAAIVGVRYGKSHYDAAEGIKSIEGSLFFFITAFLCIQIPLLLMTDFSNSHIILVSLFIALLITLCEAVAWQGLDNLFIPLGAYLILTKYLKFEISMLLMLTVILIGIMIAGLYFRKRSTMNLSALLACIILGFLYITFEPLIFVIPLSMLLFYSFISRKEHAQLKDAHTVLTIFYLNLGGLFWAFLKNSGYESLNLEFCIYYCIQMGIISWIHQYLYHKRTNFVYPIINANILLTVITMLYTGKLNVFTNEKYYYYAFFTTISLTVCLFIFTRWAKKYEVIPTDRERLIMQGGSAFFGSVLFLMLRSIHV
jgi:phytol kinase